MWFCACVRVCVWKLTAVPVCRDVWPTTEFSGKLWHLFFLRFLRRLVLVYSPSISELMESLGWHLWVDCCLHPLVCWMSLSLLGTTGNIPVDKPICFSFLNGVITPRILTPSLKAAVWFGLTHGWTICCTSLFQVHSTLARCRWILLCRCFLVLLAILISSPL